MFDCDFSLQVLGKPAGNLPNDPVLAPGGLYEDIDPCDQQQ